MNINSNYLIHVSIIGNSRVGKTSICNEYIGNDSDHITGIDCKTQDIEHKDNIIKLYIWDAVRYEHLSSIIPSFYRDTHIFFLVFDITDMQSFYSCKYHIKNIYETCKQKYMIVLLGNKLDLNYRRIISFKEAFDFSKLHNFDYYEVSAESGENVKYAINSSVKKYYDFYQYIISDEKSLETNINDDKHVQCCNLS